MPRQLFLLGGSAAFDVTAVAFVPAAGGRHARIALLLQGGRDWQKSVPEYTRAWHARGASRYDIVAPDDAGRLDVDQVTAMLERATGIFIAAHFTAENALSHLLDAMARVRRAWGIDDGACVVLENEKFARVLQW